MSRFEFTKKEVEEYLESISYKKCKIKEMLFFYKNKELQKLIFLLHPKESCQKKLQTWPNLQMQQIADILLIEIMMVLFKVM